MDYGSVSFIMSAGIIVGLIWVLSLWQVFTKAGYKGWKCLIPIYNVYILSKIGSQPTWVFILAILPVTSVIGMLLISITVAKSFGKSSLFGIIALYLFSFFGYMYIGWGQAEYKKLEVTE
jgi:hypothetical protein